MSGSQRTDEAKARMKDLGRDSRLSFRNLAEHQLRKNLKEEAMEKCKPHLKDFAECAQEKGLMVVFSCKQYHKAVQECLAKNNSEEEWEKYKAVHAEELEVRTEGKKYKK